MATGHSGSCRVDEIQVPFGYRSIQTANLIDWDGTATNPEFAKLVKAITDLVPEKASSTVQSEGRQDTRAPADIGYESPMTTRPDSSKSRTVDSSARVVGIELGATNSVVAVMKGGQLMVIPNQQDVRSTPSIVAFTKSGELLVGNVAKRQAVTNPKNTIYSIRRLMGRRYNEISGETKLFPYKIVSGNNGDAHVEIQGKKYSPPEISAMILAKLKDAAEAHLGEKVTKAVIAVPASFSDAQRQATKEAVGLRVWE